MNKISIYFLLFFIGTTPLFAQSKKFKSPEIGMVPKLEQELRFYEKDTTASAVYLNEWGYNYFKIVNNQIRIIKEYYAKIKILKPEGLEYATIEIPYYRNAKTSEIVRKIKGVSTLDGKQTYLQKSAIFQETINENWNQMKFTFPNAKVGSVLEYKYTMETPFLFNFEGWYFQSTIPKVKSTFNAKIFGNYRYNRNLRGSLKLSKNEASIEKRCFYIPGAPEGADCEVLEYGMYDIPAFKKEDHMLAAKNYISRIKFELSEQISFYEDRPNKKYTKSWKDVDKDFRRDKDIGGQLKKTNYFKKHLPLELQQIPNDLDRAKAVYYFIQNHYKWNGYYRIFDNDNIKRAFENKKGNVGEINLSLINALNAVHIPTKLMLLSTRKNGLPTKAHPVISDFNYLIAISEINGETVKLDATVKQLPFGDLPFHCLNYEGRVMDFKNASYWEAIKAKSEKISAEQLSLKLNKSGEFTGNLRIINSGYAAINKRYTIITKGEDNYLNQLETSYNDAEFKVLEISGLHDPEKNILESYEVSIPTEEAIGSKTYLQVFFTPQLFNNPFKLNDRRYPIDYGYKRKYTYNFHLQIPTGYKVASKLTNKAFTIANNGGKMTIMSNISDTFVKVRFQLHINATHFSSDYYTSLKAFYEKVLEVQKNAVIVLKKV